MVLRVCCLVFVSLVYCLRAATHGTSDVILREVSVGIMPCRRRGIGRAKYIRSSECIVFLFAGTARDTLQMCVHI